ncbi:hypothetical protein EUTSA_v10015613mg [Eutrema salsugineum]|uniref:RNA polymerase subunit H/Rpb5 C-terminal domain-containing protein n=1 Tax=Eutrema salsugineum TaxID=72664 RepID=V4LHY3_EUTSA|nr:DNA-directed RNA polymerases II and IV subunit 5A [Eutrema salsugineum]ESQ41997.1 hypothetical protein EUTSA_v10015613mg [Eutrema salsugineum]
MDLSEKEISKLFRVHKTVNQMLKDRGYIVMDSEIEMTKEQFLEKYGGDMAREDLDTLKIKRDDDSDKIFVFFMEETDGAKLGIKDIKPFIERMQSENVFKAILVVQKHLTRHALDALDLQSKLHLQVFQDTELLMNVKGHVFVPHHQALTTEEKKALLERYTMKENQLPRIQYTDPIAKYYGLRRGQVVKIIRPSETSGRYVTYRYVV